MRDGIKVASNIEVDDLMMAITKIFLHFTEGILTIAIRSKPVAVGTGLLWSGYLLAENLDQLVS